MRRAKWIVLSVLVAGCGAVERDAASGKPSEAPGGELSALGEAARLPRAGDLAIAVTGPSPVGRIAPELAGEYPLTLTIVSSTDDPLALAGVRVITTIDAGADGACAPRETALLEAVLAPRAVVTVPLALPCGLDGGDHVVDVRLARGSALGPDAGLAARASMTLAIDPAARWFVGADRAAPEPAHDLGLSPGTLLE